MAKYSGIFSCGHEGTVGIIGPMKDREWKKERAFSKMCPECYSKYLAEEREKANREAEKKNKEWELPELTGTEKQVAWANTLRIEFIDKIKNKLHELNENQIDRDYKEYLRDNNILLKEFKTFIKDVDWLIDYILNNKTEARFYIDNRTFSLNLLMSLYKENEIAKEKEEMKDIINESTLIPKEIKYQGFVEIKFNEDNISATYEKNYDFRDIVKDLGYKWGNGCWIKKIKETSGLYKDRVAELGNKLLNAGFSVLILDEEARKKAVNADYEVECTRWIYRRKGTTKLALNWKERNENLYNAARKLPGSKWDSPSVIVDVSHFKEIEEFAELYGFKFTVTAREYIEKYKEEITGLSTVEVVNSKECIEKDGLKEILNSSRDVLDDLKEDD